MRRRRHITVALLATLFCGAAFAYSLLTTDRHVLKKDPDQVGAPQNRFNYDATAAPASASREEVERELHAAMALWNAVPDSRWIFDDQFLGNADGLPHSTTDGIHDISWTSWNPVTPLSNNRK